MKEKMNIANLTTLSRIVFAAIVLFSDTFSVQFYIFYLLGAFTDMIDGTVARKTNTVSEYGSKLDTAADFVFVVVCLIKMIPALNIDAWIYVWVVAIVVIKVINVVSGYVKQKKFVAVHTVMNKVTGALLFALPLTSHLVELRYSAIVVCAVATFAAIQEGHFIKT